MKEEFPVELFRSIREPLLDWFAVNQRTMAWRSDPSPYHVWLSEIMLQQTRVEAVRAYFERFIKVLPDIASLAAAPEDVLMKLWEGLGYYSRVRNLQKAAKIVMTEFGGTFPDDFESIRSLPGIGDYTAGAIASIAFGIPVPAVDGNVLRVGTRLAGSESDITKPETKELLRSVLSHVYPADRAGDFTQSLMELGAIVCLPNGEPKCTVCPLSGFCAAYRDNSFDRIPVKAPKKARRMEQLTVLVMEYDGKIALRKRSAKGLLAGMTEFPNLKGFYSEDMLKQYFRKERIFALEMIQQPDGKHIFTHIEWQMKIWKIKLSARPDVSGLLWMSPDEIRKYAALPAAFSKNISF